MNSGAIDFWWNWDYVTDLAEIVRRRLSSSQIRAALLFVCSMFALVCF